MADDEAGGSAVGVMKDESSSECRWSKGRIVLAYVVLGLVALGSTLRSPMCHGGYFTPAFALCQNAVMP